MAVNSYQPNTQGVQNGNFNPKFCTDCGAKLDIGARFCKNCGGTVEQVSSSAAKGYRKFDEPMTERKTVFEGEIHKCPNCGELLGAFVYVCQSCGYEIRGAGLSRSIYEFSKKLENSTSEKYSISLIRNFPVPNTKEDVFEFMILASTNISGDISQKICDALQVKVEQSYQKAKLLFDSDEELLQVQGIYDKTIKKINKSKTAQQLKNTGNVIVRCGKLFLRLLNYVLRNLLFILGILSYYKAIQIDNLNDNSVGFELLGGILMIISSFLLMRKQANLFDILLGFGCGIFTFYLASSLDNGSGLQLFGGLTLLVVLISFINKIMSGNEKEGD